MTTPLPQGELTIERMCALAGVSRAGYYRYWAASAPRAEDTAVRDAIQRLALAHRHYGYRRIAAQLRREGLAVNRKRVLRLMRQDNLLCLRQKPFVPVTTDSRHAWRDGAEPGARHGADRPRPALGGRHHLYSAAGGVRLSGRRARCLQPPRGRLGAGNHLEASLAIAALAMALEARRPGPAA